jgi:DNA-binding NarL/FixJ family response regulator
LIDRYVTQPLHRDADAVLKKLTKREREAVALVAQGLSNDQIAGRMVISPITAKTHINRAMTKLHARAPETQPRSNALTSACPLAGDPIRRNVP